MKTPFLTSVVSFIASKKMLLAKKKCDNLELAVKVYLSGSKYFVSVENEYQKIWVTT